MVISKASTCCHLEEKKYMGQVSPLLFYNSHFEKTKQGQKQNEIRNYICHLRSTVSEKYLLLNLQ